MLKSLKTLEDLKNGQLMYDLINAQTEEIANLLRWKTSQETRGEEARLFLAESGPASCSQFHHQAGLCDNAGCTGCVESKAKYAQQIIKEVRAGIFARLSQAAKDEDLVEDADLLATRFVQIEAGKNPPPVYRLNGLRIERGLVESNAGQGEIRRQSTAA